MIHFHTSDIPFTHMQPSEVNFVHNGSPWVATEARLKQQIRVLTL